MKWIRRGPTPGYSGSTHATTGCFSAEMAATFEEAAVEHLSRGRVDFARFAASELIGLVRGAAAERVGEYAYALYMSADLARLSSLAAELVAKCVYAAFRSNGSFRSRCVRDWRMMRPAGASWETWYSEGSMN